MGTNSAWIYKDIMSLIDTMSYSAITVRSTVTWLDPITAREKVRQLLVSIVPVTTNQRNVLNGRQRRQKKLNALTVLRVRTGMRSASVDHIKQEIIRALATSVRKLT
jgi:hypothetical protein